MTSPTSSTTTSRVPLSQVRDDYELYSTNFLKIVNIKVEGQLIPFEWNKPQRKLAAAVKWQEQRGLPVRVVILKSRKVGISTWVQGWNFWRAHLRENRNAVTIAHDQESSMLLFEAQRRFYDHFAEFPDSHPLWVQKRHLTRRQISFISNRSSTRVLVVSKGTGRGMDAFDVHASEFAFWETAKEAMLAIRNAVPRLAGTSVFIESTPHGWGNEFHGEWERAKAKTSGYIAVFIGWYDDPRANAIPWFDERDLDETERELIGLYGVTLENLAWRRNMIADECGGDAETFLQEYPSDDRSCFLSSGRPAFDAEGMRYQQDGVPSPDPWEGAPPASEIEAGTASGPNLIIRPTQRGRLRIYKDVVPRHHYIAGIDPSEGDPGSTASPIAVLDQYTMELSALWYGRTPPDLLAEHAVRICNYYNEAGMIWEANNHGLAFGQRVSDLEYFNVYMRKTSDESVAQAQTDKPGYMNTERSRQHLFNTLRAYVREARIKKWPALRDPVMVGEILTLIYEGDKAVAQPGRLYDTLIAFGLALVWHRGSRDAPLEPLSLEVMQRAHEQVGWRFQIGERPSLQEMKGLECTAEELERYDDMMYELERTQRRRGLGRAT